MYKNTIKLCFLLVYFTGIGAYFHPQSVGDFCSLPCNYTYTDKLKRSENTVRIDNTACQCRRNPRCRSLPLNTTELMSFRGNILKSFNYVRGNTPNVSNMNTVVYDVSLEFQAYCYAMRCNIGIEETCRGSIKFPNGIGQLTHTQFTNAIPTYLSNYEGVSNFITNAWFEPGKKDYRGKYVEGDEDNRAWACLVWPTHTHVGCAVSIRVGPDDAILATNWVCNLGGSDTMFATVGADMLIEEKNGSSCVDCATECIKAPTLTYESLCGLEEPVPEDVWEDFPIVDPLEHIRNEKTDGYPIGRSEIKVTMISHSIRIHSSYILIITVVSIIHLC